MASFLVNERNTVIIQRVDCPKDCIRIRNALLELGYDINLYDVEWFWKLRSADVGAAWLYVKEDDESLKEDISANTDFLLEAIGDKLKPETGVG